MSAETQGAETYEPRELPPEIDAAWLAYGEAVNRVHQVAWNDVRGFEEALGDAPHRLREAIADALAAVERERDEARRALEASGQQGALEVLARVFDDGADAAHDEWLGWYEPKKWLSPYRALGAFIRRLFDSERAGLMQSLRREADIAIDMHRQRDEAHDLLRDARRFIDGIANADAFYGGKANETAIALSDRILAALAARPAETPEGR